MRCPHCEASNPESARFCGQCYEVFDTPQQGDTPQHGEASSSAESWAGPEDMPPADAAAPLAPLASGPGESAAPDRGHGGTVAIGRFVAGEDGLTWRCAICETTHPVGVFVCTVCGAKMDAEASAAGAAPVDLEQAKRAEAVVPGLGHLRTGHRGMGAARIGIVVVWLLGSMVLASGGLSGLLTAVPLVLGMVVIWATGPGDLAAAAAGRAPRLDARRFMYLVIGVTAGVIAAGGLAIVL